MNRINNKQSYGVGAIEISGPIGPQEPHGYPFAELIVYLFFGLLEKQTRKALKWQKPK